VFCSRGLAFRAFKTHSYGVGGANDPRHTSNTPFIIFATPLAIRRNARKNVKHRFRLGGWGSRENRWQWLRLCLSLVSETKLKPLAKVKWHHLGGKGVVTTR